MELFTADLHATIDSIAVVVLGASSLLSTLIAGLIVLALVQWARGERQVGPGGFRSPATLLSTLLFLAVLGLGIYYLPRILFDGVDWAHVRAWYPASLPVAVIGFSVTVVLFALYHLVLETLPKPYERPYFLLGTLSVVSALGYTFIMFVISQALSGQTAGGALFLYFVIAILFYVYAQRIVRSKLIRLANSLVFEKRLDLMVRLLRTSYARFEQINSSRIFASLGTDMETVSNSVRDLVTVVTSVASIVLFLIYLGMMSLYGLLLSFLFILAGIGVMMVVNGYAEKYWVKVHQTQTAFFGFMHDLVGGFKELSLHRARRQSFEEDLRQNLTTYRDQRIRVELLFTNGFILGQLLIYLVIGTVVFVFPLLFPEIRSEALQDYVLAFLFLVGPISSVVDLMPRAAQMALAWKRMDALLAEAAALSAPAAASAAVPGRGEVELSVRGVAYQYRGEDGESFNLGPVDCEFRSGEITFITGGNGSGKSTLAKLITGLYVPTAGEIRINGAPVEPGHLGEYYCTVFNDFYLFEKLYGIDHQAKAAEIDRYLKLLRIDDKVAVKDGAFSSTKLSTGQRKRLALLLSYVDDRPLYLLDEWAAEQDPEFRRFFYEELLPDMRTRGKCIIAITHDDRYFDLADRVIKMEMGQIVGGR